MIIFTAYGLDLLMNNFKTIVVVTGIAYFVMFGVFLKEYFTREPYIYGDDVLIEGDSFNRSSANNGGAIYIYGDNLIITSFKRSSLYISGEISKIEFYEVK